MTRNACGNEYSEALYASVQRYLTETAGGPSRQRSEIASDFAWTPSSGPCLSLAISAAIETIHSSIADFTQARNSRQSPMLSSLPDELLVECFKPLSFQDRVRASQVSRAWRATLLGNATFWTTIRMSHSHSSEQAVSRLRNMLLRSGSALLDVHWDEYPVFELLDDHQKISVRQLFSQNLRRIRRLVINYSDLDVLWQHQAPSLESLDLHTPVPPGLINIPYLWIRDCAPRLKTLSVGHFALPIDPSPLRNITAFSGSPGYGGARRLFDFFPCLASLSLNEVDNLGQLPQFVLPSVEEIVLVSDNALDFSTLLHAWTTPPSRGKRCFEIGAQGPQALSAALQHLAAAQPVTAPSIAVEFDGPQRIVLSTSAPYDLKIVLLSGYHRAFNCTEALPGSPYLGMIQSLRLSGMMLTSVLRTEVEFPSVRKLAIEDAATFGASSIRMAIRRRVPALRVPRVQDLVFDFAKSDPRSQVPPESQRTVSQLADFVGSHLHLTEGSLASITIIDPLLPQWEDVSGLLAYTPRIYHCYGSRDSPQEMAEPGRS
ncbi:hypothetical protein AURDEDRAFT_154527 [Auricularia subglabra TFB-10046 SS5]|nr:hypothetical protein AURDEDRAFT_154527 [Auricularia subglabra TFB-10046 SS5]